MKRKASAPKAKKTTKRARSVPQSRMPAAIRARGTEVKALDQPLSVEAVSTTATFRVINLLQAGASFFNRIGRRVEMKSLHFNGALIPVRSNANVDYIRILMIYDRQVNGTLPAIADVLQDTQQAGTNFTNSFSGINLNNRDRFLVIMDKRITLPPMVVTAGVSVVASDIGIDPMMTTFNISEYRKLKGLLAQFKVDSNPAVIGDIATGAIYVITLGTQAIGTEGYQLDYSVRLRFNDV